MKPILEYLLSKQSYENHTLYSDIKEDANFMFSDDEVDKIKNAFDISKMKPLVLTNKFASKSGHIISHKNMILAHFSEDWETRPLFNYPTEIDCITINKPAYYDNGNFYAKVVMYKKGNDGGKVETTTYSLDDLTDNISKMKSPF